MKVEIFLKRMEDFDKINAVYEKVGCSSVVVQPNTANSIVCRHSPHQSQLVLAYKQGMCI